MEKKPLILDEGRVKTLSTNDELIHSVYDSILVDHNFEVITDHEGNVLTQGD